MTATAVTTSPF